MDPISQGIVGAAAGGAVGGARMPRASLLIGFLTGLTADLDVFIPTGGDPTAGMVWHRGITHALAFIPVGAAVCFAPCLLVPSLRREWKRTFLVCLAAYATHAPLDALTSYGTQLLLPFSSYRAALDWMPIVDPVFTITLVALVFLAAIKGAPRISALALAFAGLYVGFGAWQHHRAVDVMHALADRRGHTIEHARVHPAPGGLSLWRSVYISDGRIWADGIFVPYSGSVRVREGESRRLFSVNDLPAHSRSDASLRQYDVFEWFSDGFVVAASGQPEGVIADARYSADPAGFEPLWGMDFSGAEPRLYRPRVALSMEELLNALLGGDERYVLPGGGVARPLGGDRCASLGGRSLRVAWGAVVARPWGAVAARPWGAGCCAALGGRRLRRLGGVATRPGREGRGCFEIDAR